MGVVIMNYNINLIGRSIEMSKPNSSILLYRFPYQNLLSGEKNTFEIKNKFIVYILTGKNEKGEDVIYVGKSKNGLKNRPTSHNDKFAGWSHCYVLTEKEEHSYFSDGTIQYIENQINKTVEDLGRFINTTHKTTPDTINKKEKDDCEEFLKIAFDMFDILGLDLITRKSDDDESEIEEDVLEVSVPDGLYTFSQKLKRWKGRQVNATMQVANGKYILLAGSDVCPYEGDIYDAVHIKRATANIVDDVLQEDIVFSSPSGPAIFVTGGARNGWFCWKDEKGTAINQYRKQ